MNTPKQRCDLETLLTKVEDNTALTPAQLGFLVDQFKLVEAERLLADKVAAAKKAQEVRIKLCIASSLKASETTVAGGTAFKVEMTEDLVPTVEDWPKFYAYIAKTKSWDLLERRPGKAAVKARWEDGKTVPGVTSFSVDKFSFTKLKG